MTATACILATLLLFEVGASPPAPARECELTDNRCKAALYQRKAAKTASARDRALYLYAAYRSYIFLYEKTGDIRDLCAARRSYNASMAVKGQPSAQHAQFESFRSELESLERRANARCENVVKQPRSKKADPPLIAHHDPPEPPPLPVAQPDPVTAPVAVTSAPTSARATDPRLLSTASEMLRTDADEPAALMRVERHPALPRRVTPTPRPGGGLVIASGLTMGLGIGLTAAAAHLGRQALQTRQEALALHAMIDGYATSDMAAQGNALTVQYNALKTQALALVFTGSVTIVVAVVLASVGGRRMARAASRVALVPAPRGLAFHARF